MERRAYMHALAHVYMRNVAYAHSTSLIRHTCAHANAHSQTDRFTHRDGISQERHTQTHTCTHMHTHAHTCTHMHKRTHTQLPTYTHTHMNTCRYTKEHALIQTNTQTYTQTYTRPHTHSCTHKRRDRDRDGISHEQNAHRHTQPLIYTGIFTHICTRDRVSMVTSTRVQMHAHTHT